MKVNKKLILFLIITIFTFGIINTYAEENITLDLTQVPEEELVSPNEEENKEYNYINQETNYRAIIDDSANLLSYSEKEKLFEEMIPLTKYGHVGFVSTNNNYNSVDYFADSYYHSHFNQESGTIFIIDMSNRKIYIFSDGENYRTITSAKAYSITDNTYRYATREEYYYCAHYSFKDINTLLEGKKIAEPMRYTSNIFIALTLAFFFSFIYILSKSRMSKASNKTVIGDCVIDFQISQVSAVKTGQHSVYSPASSGGSSGGGGGGGGSSGGGGGHSF